MIPDLVSILRQCQIDWIRSFIKDYTENGIEVSGGEVQKMLLSLYKDAPFIILDEPTAIAGDKTTIYISHRLSSCKFCEVFHEGRIV